MHGPARTLPSASGQLLSSWCTKITFSRIAWEGGGHIHMRGMRPRQQLAPSTSVCMRCKQYVMIEGVKQGDQKLLIRPPPLTRP